MHAIITPPTTAPSSPSNGLADEVATICHERALRQVVPQVGPSRLANQQSRTTACEIYLQDNPQNFETDIFLPATGDAGSSTNPST